MNAKSPVLLVEDETMLRFAATEMLESSGFEVLEASDGVEGLHLLKSNPNVALLISDVRMPRMDGYALVEAALDFKPDLKVLLMTGYGGESVPAFVRERGIEILHKPFNLEKLCVIAERAVV